MFVFDCGYEAHDVSRIDDCRDDVYSDDERVSNNAYGDDAQNGENSEKNDEKHNNNNVRKSSSACDELESILSPNENVF